MKRPGEDVILEMQDVKIHFDMDEGLLKAVDGVDFVIKKGRTLGIVGESGCGKSVTTNAIFKILPKYGIIGGDIWLYEKDGKELDEPINIAKLDPTGDEIRSIRGGNIAMIFQEPMKAFSPVHTIGNQIMETIMLHIEPDEKKARQICIEALRQVGISNPEQRVDEYPHQLSGGMRQRAIIALATFMSPNVVLADEPTTALDVVVQRGILMMLMRLQKQLKNTLVIVSHDMGVHYQITDRMGIMYSGSFVELGKTEDIFNDPIHPYTKMLIGALPRVGDKSQKVGIPGSPPSLKNPPAGCRFAPRCPHATDKCRQDVPEFREIRPGRFAACHYLESEVK